MIAAAFRDAIIRAGMEAPHVIEAGRIFRFPGFGKGQSNRAGWCFLFPDLCGGVFGDWSSGLYQHWWAPRTNSKPISKVERKAFARQCRKAAAERARIHQAEQLAAAEQASKQYAAATAANPKHGYLLRKRITAPPEVRQAEGRLLIPMRDVATGKLRGLQGIAFDGAKRFTLGVTVKGCIFSFEGPHDGPVLLCEGFATGASLSMATGWQVVCAFTALNLPNVASALRQQNIGRPIVIAADNDHKNERLAKGNAGMESARKAAQAARAILLAPSSAHFGSDWNDFAQNQGVETLGKILREALASVAHTPEAKAVRRA